MGNHRKVLLPKIDAAGFFINMYYAECLPTIIVRGDSHFTSNDLMDWCHYKDKVNFITGLAGNAKLKEKAYVTIKSAEREFEQYGKPVKRYHSFIYKAASWKYSQRVIVKVEISQMGTNIR